MNTIPCDLCRRPWRNSSRRSRSSPRPPRPRSPRRAPASVRISVCMYIRDPYAYVYVCMYLSIYLSLSLSIYIYIHRERERETEREGERKTHTPHILHMCVCVCMYVYVGTWCAQIMMCPGLPRAREARGAKAVVIRRQAPPSLGAEYYTRNHKSEDPR